MSKTTETLATLLNRLNTPITEENETDLETTAIALGQLGEEALPAISNLMASTNADHRFLAVRSLWANNTPTAHEYLIALLADTDDMISSVAALALGELKVESAIPNLMQLIHIDSQVGNHAADALAKIGQAAAPHLITALSDERNWVRVRAAKALIPIESKEAIRSLIHCLDYDDSYLVRHYADIALKRMGVGEMIYFVSQ